MAADPADGAVDTRPRARRGVHHPRGGSAPRRLPARVPGVSHATECCYIFAQYRPVIVLNADEYAKNVLNIEERS